MLGDDVDLYKLPIPMSSIYDGGPMITAGVVIARDPELGINSGIYRFIVKEKSLTGIDIVTPNNMRLFAQRAFEAGRRADLDLDRHPSDRDHRLRLPRAARRRRDGDRRGFRGAPVELAPCETIDLPYIADAEIVLEAEILPTGWTWPEGPLRRVHPADGRPALESAGAHQGDLDAQGRDLLQSAHAVGEHLAGRADALCGDPPGARTAGVQVKDINVTLGGCAFWHAVISIKKQPGEGKNALLAALSVMDLKHVVVVDDDIDIYDPTEVEWAIATRVQGDKDVMIVSNARAKPLDPSLPQGYGVVPTGAKVGIDATIPEGIPSEHYERITYAYADTRQDRRLRQRQGRRGGEAGDERAVAALAREDPGRDRQGAALLHRHRRAVLDYDFRTVARALGHLHATEKLWQDPRGQMCVRGSEFAAKPPRR